MESASRRVQDEVTKMVTQLDKDFLRKMQGDMYRCSAKCCDSVDASAERTQSCIDRCQTPAQEASKFMEDELTNFQNRLQRCAMDCQDKTRDKMTSGGNETEKNALMHQMESCVMKCVDSHIALLPALQKRIKTSLSSKLK